MGKVKETDIVRALALAAMKDTAQFMTAETCEDMFVALREGNESAFHQALGKMGYQPMAPVPCLPPDVITTLHEMTDGIFDHFDSLTEKINANSWPFQIRKSEHTPSGYFMELLGVIKREQ